MAVRISVRTKSYTGALQLNKILATDGARKTEDSFLNTRHFLLCLTHSTYEQNGDDYVTTAGWIINVNLGDVKISMQLKEKLEEKSRG
jgi:hypothetical protein